jgi:hypothetical protein
MLYFAKRDKAMTLQRYMPTFFQAEGSEERWAGMREDSQDGAWCAVADVDQRVSHLESALRGILALADISKPVDADALTAAVRRGWVALQSETLPRRAHSKSEYKRLSALGVECAPPETAYRSAREMPDGGYVYADTQEKADAKVSAAETSVAPIAGAGQLCRLCGNVHDLMSACPPKETACTCDSTLVTDTSNHQPHCPRYVAETVCEREGHAWVEVGPSEAPWNKCDECGATKKTGTEHG